MRAVLLVLIFLGLLSTLAGGWFLEVHLLMTRMVSGLIGWVICVASNPDVRSETRWLATRVEGDVA